MLELPRGSHYQSSLMGDDELIFAELDRNGKPKARHKPALKGWDDGRADMADVKDLLRAMIAAITRSERRPDPWPRPETSFDRWDDAQRKLNTDFINKALGI